VPQKIRELKRQLRRAGFSSRSGKGSHTVWIHPLLPEDELTISGGDGDDAKKYQELDVRNILKKLWEAQDNNG
jgi:predicted RNA binding protein YcfA (HicA-like mRNA interferase family)